MMQSISKNIQGVRMLLLSFSSTPSLSTAHHMEKYFSWLIHTASRPLYLSTYVGPEGDVQEAQA